MPVRKTLDIKELKPGDTLVCSPGGSNQVRYIYKVLRVWIYYDRNYSDGTVKQKLYRVAVRSDCSFVDFDQHRFNWYVIEVIRKVDTLFGSVNQLIMSK